MPKITARTVYSVGIFLIVSIIAFSALIGVIYFVSQRGEQARRSEAREIARQMEDEKEQNNQGSSTSDTSSTVSDNGKDTASDSDGTLVIGTNTDDRELPATGAPDQLYQVAVVTIVSLSLALFMSSRRAAT